MSKKFSSMHTLTRKMWGLFSRLLQGMYPRKGFLVCFSGTDGSGKSSHANSLRNHLSTQGYACYRVWFRIRLILSYFFYGFTWLLGYWGKKRSNGEYAIDPLGKAPKNVREKGLDSLRLLFLFADFQIITLKARLLLLLGKTVVVDRYVYDLIAGLMVLGQLTNSFAKLLLQTVPAPNLTIFLDAPEDVISARRSIPIDVARKKREKYLLLASALNFSVLDTSNDFSENQKEVRRKFFLYLKNAKENAEGRDI